MQAAFAQLSQGASFSRRDRAKLADDARPMQAQQGRSVPLNAGGLGAHIPAKLDFFASAPTPASASTATSASVSRGSKRAAESDGDDDDDDDQDDTRGRKKSVAAAASKKPRHQTEDLDDDDEGEADGANGAAGLNKKKAAKQASKAKDRRGKGTSADDEDEQQVHLFAQSKAQAVKSKAAKAKAGKSAADAEQQEAQDDAEAERRREINRHQQEVAVFRKQLGIHIHGAEAPEPMRTFDATNPRTNKPYFSKTVQRNVAALGFTEPTPIQMQTMPVLLQRTELLAHAPTGSGKTAAFALPIIEALDRHVSGGGVRALIISPTRELAQQIHREFSRLAEGRGLKISLLTKSVAAGAQLPTRGIVADDDSSDDEEDEEDEDEEDEDEDDDEDALSDDDVPTTKHKALKSAQKSKGKAPMAVTKSKKAPQMEVADEQPAVKPRVATPDFDVLVTTPMRLVNILRQVELSLASVEWLICDEADNLFGMGFLEQVDEILAACSNPNITRALFSATMPSGVEEVARTLLNQPLRVGIGAGNMATENVKQQLLFVGREEGKILAIQQMIQKGVRPPILVFVQSVDRAKQLHREMLYEKMNVDVIHAERTSLERETAIKNFRTGKTWFLIATELLARGMDFKGVNLVINFDFPQTAESYIHRIGRTGRAGRPGEAITFFTKEDSINLRTVVNVMKESGCDVPEWMLSLQKPNKSTRKRLAKKPIQRDDISATSAYDRERQAKRRQFIEHSKAKGKGANKPKAATKSQ
ncbi:hypothetical protein CAOG_08519 [Capsaspora owczarzaki ATCC 30864]|uniref:RNA helicase n=1 Tax=Capsaspora owczarzaki (strain ATCC 30864) TaxID=595528 RepID=A0A0D2U4V8_CAPO3|nr:hypothetical protein CAOG_08519 [Capsaspora owczarzaki ATCC 30864]KJE90181.1 hypothetical protein CAOG_008519 [Capsaspora owczarzaki ATCC 30864]|eukprot:XP_011270100.1 hypothetical protein CAOG_08519 [Capsaspora owczarzaki ATCC 30864]